mmetsp:Transcript_118723/g.369898  ORF Transcript_118723/g.369898 Transcript_118723/m.369898 type:complete len:249 (+) Transcript_118723:712-1458(+)
MKPSSMPWTCMRMTGGPQPFSIATWSSSCCSPGAKSSRAPSIQRDRLQASKYMLPSFSCRWAKRRSFASLRPASLREPCCLITARRTPAKRSMACTLTVTETSWLRTSRTVTSTSGSSPRSAGNVAQSSARLGPTRTVPAKDKLLETASRLSVPVFTSAPTFSLGPSAGFSGWGVSAVCSLPSLSCRHGGQDACRCTCSAEPPHCRSSCRSLCTSDMGAPTLRLRWKSPAVECTVTFCSRRSVLPMHM